jgi:NAD(P)-dependent dehydrogenase (short-subunit alcohol dehydrogenase family)
MQQCPAEDYEDLTSVHLRGTLLADEYAARTMAATGGGSIVTFSSAASFGVDEKTSAGYSASKAGINALTRRVPAPSRSIRRARGLVADRPRPAPRGPTA